MTWERWAIVALLPVTAAAWAAWALMQFAL